MEIVFADPTLALLTGEKPGQTKLPVAAIKSARRRLLALRAAVDDRSLRNWKSLGYESLGEGRDGQRSIRVNGQFRMIFTLNDTEPLTATILSIEGLQ